MTKNAHSSVVGNGQTSIGIPAGQNGMSTGSMANPQAGSTAAPPSSSVISSTLTGAAASEASASLASQSSQNLGSNGMYTTTTGSNIVGISNSISGGFDQATATNPMAQSSSTGNSGLSIYSLLSAWPLMMAGIAVMFGALVVL